MNPIAFGKKCRIHHLEYSNIFGYIPSPHNYECTQEEYFDALLEAVAEKKELSELLSVKKYNY